MSNRKAFEEELNELKVELVRMCRITEEMIIDSIEALIKKDGQLAASVPPRDREVDEFELDIERKCMRILLRRQPVADDFREVSTALKLITDIERIGDQASDIAEIVLSFNGENYIKELVHLKAMGELVVKMVRSSVDSFIRSDVKLADEIIASDDTLDKLFLVVKEELIELIRADSANADQAISFMMIAKYLERIGDHAVNVCEWTKYFGTGVHVKY
ncbi:MAG: phosphate signaling complex protein PhoU [Christensenellales bacterium]|jgi:phosphate transport system regulatory protein phoU